MEIIIDTYNTDAKKFVKQLEVKSPYGNSVHDVYEATNPDGVTYLVFVWQHGMSLMNWTAEDYQYAAQFINIGKNEPLVLQSGDEYVNIPLSYRYPD